jgi:hypothetical protein
MDHGSIHTHCFSASYEQYLADMFIVQSIACSDLLGHYDVLKNSANGPQVGKQHGHNESVFVTGSIQFSLSLKLNFSLMRDCYALSLLVQTLQRKVISVNFE